MLDNIIEIKVNKSLSGLAGYDYGKEIYIKQVKDKVDISKKIIIIFPDNIKRIASSFVQGFFEEFVKEIGITGIKNHIELSVSSDKLKNSIYNNLI